MLPTLKASATPVPSNMVRLPAAPAAPNMPATDANARSSLMISSLPGIGSGPDAVQRQFNGGRPVTSYRLLVS